MIHLLLAGLLAAQSVCPNAWKEGEPVVLSDVANCLKDERIRAQFEKRALGGDAEAASTLADYYMEGAGQSDAEAIRWLKVHSRLSGKYPMVLGQLLLKSKDEKQRNEGVELLRTRSVEGDEESAEVLADYLISEGKPIEAAAWYQVAAVGGNVEAMIKLGDVELERDDQPSKAIGVAWTVVAARTFKAGSFREQKLMEKAKHSSAKFDLDLEAISKFADSINAVEK